MGRLAWKRTGAVGGRQRRPLRPTGGQTRLLFVGTTCEIWERITQALTLAGHRALRVDDADTALVELAIDPSTTTVILVHHDEAEDAAHLATWAALVAPLTRLVTLDGSGMLYGYGADGEATGPAGTMVAAVRRMLRN